MVRFHFSRSTDRRGQSRSTAASALMLSTRLFALRAEPQIRKLPACRCRWRQRSMGGRWNQASRPMEVADAQHMPQSPHQFRGIHGCCRWRRVRPGSFNLGGRLTRMHQAVYRPMTDDRAYAQECPPVPWLHGDALSAWVAERRASSQGCERCRLLGLFRSPAR